MSLSTLRPVNKNNVLVELSSKECSNSGATTCCCSTAGSTTDVQKSTAVMKTKMAAGSFLSGLLSVAVAFFPKCPFCWAYYMSLFGIAGMESIPYTPWLRPLIVAALGLNLFSLYRTSKARGFRFPFYVSSAGAALILLAGSMNAELVPWGIGLIVVGAVLNGLPVREFLAKLRAPEISVAASAS